MTAEKIFPRCLFFLDDSVKTRICGDEALRQRPESFPEHIRKYAGLPGIPPFLPDLADIERAVHSASRCAFPFPEIPERQIVNPSLQLVKTSYRNLHRLPERGTDDIRPLPSGETGYVMVWLDPRSGDIRCEPASNGDLLALKVIVEEISPEDAADEGKVSVGIIDGIIDNAVERGIIISPPSRIVRTGKRLDVKGFTAPNEGFSDFFTLQWHITQSCDLHCRHCYDRTDRRPLDYGFAVRILDDLRSFCRSRYVRGQVSFTGGNPFLYPRFFDLYAEAKARGFTLAVLGNPVSREKIEKLLLIEHPAFFQVSLEGLPGYNDTVRGQGHFMRTMEFLDLLREFGIYSMVMLTLHAGNMEQVIPLAEMLRDRTDLFTFNRLSPVGEGARLAMPGPGEFTAFLEDYLKAAGKNPVIGLKDNLLNRSLYRNGEKVFGGCTGFGCGAAFNFFSALADGEVHACRKFPSPIGNMLNRTIAEVYDSAESQRYRDGCADCRDCRIFPVCGGCPAVTHGCGHDVFTKRDPYCFPDCL